LRRGEEAREAINKGLSILEEEISTDDPEARLSTDIDLETEAVIMVLMLEGRNREARDFFQRAEAFISKETHEKIIGLIGPPPDFPDDVDAITRYGSDELHEGDLLKAIEWLGEGAARLEAQRESERLCGVLGDLAVAFKDVGNWAQAEAAYTRVIALCRAEGDDTNLSRWTQNMGAMLIQVGDLPQGRQYFEEGLVAAERSGSAYQISCAHGNLGVILVDEGDLAGAADAFEKALQTSPRDHLTEQWCQSLFNVLYQWGMALVDAGDTGAAIKAFERMIATFDTYGGDPSIAAIAFLRLAALLGDSFQFANAQIAAARARELYQAAGDYDGVRSAQAMEEEITRVMRG
jgi:tetratricopeptide (TPR) repeat protein